jgi:hypothetical protein
MEMTARPSSKPASCTYELQPTPDGWSGRKICWRRTQDAR